MLCGAGVQRGTAFNCTHSILIFQARQTMGDYWRIIEAGAAGRTHGEMGHGIRSELPQSSDENKLFSVSTCVSVPAHVCVSKRARACVIRFKQ